MLLLLSAVRVLRDKSQDQVTDQVTAGASDNVGWTLKDIIGNSESNTDVS